MTKIRKDIDDIEGFPDDAAQQTQELENTLDTEAKQVEEDLKPKKRGSLNNLSTDSWIVIGIMGLVITLAAGGLGYYLGGYYEQKRAEEAYVAANPEARQEEIFKAVDEGKTNIAGAKAGKDFQKDAPKGGWDATLSGGTISIEDLQTDPNGGWKFARRNPADPMAQGAVDAPVVLSLFSDLECPYCAQFAKDDEPDFVKKYVDTGLVRLEWNDMPVVDPAFSVDDAIAGRAAAAQGKFWEYQKAAYDFFNDDTGHPEFTKEQRIEFAKKAGVPDIDRFTKDLSNKDLAKAVDDATAFGQALGVPAVPGLLMSGAGQLAQADAAQLAAFAEMMLYEAKDAQDQGLGVRGPAESK